MADDTTIRTVEEAKRFAMHVAASYCSGDLRFDQFNDAMDALIAAVRAENALPVGQWFCACAARNFADAPVCWNCKTQRPS
jgi:flavodoxin